MLFLQTLKRELLMKIGHNGKINLFLRNSMNFTKKNGDYNDGIALIPGKIWKGQFKGKYLVAIDLDNKKAIEEFVCSEFGLEELKQKTLVEQHADSNKMHIYFIVEREISNKSTDKTNVDIVLLT